MRHALLLLLALGAAALALAQANPRGEAKVTLAGKTIRVEYGRPSLKGRDMLARAGVGQEWRMGADASTTLETEAELSFGPEVVPGGNYVLTATRVAADKWQLNVTSGGSDPDRVADVPLVWEQLAESVEVFTIELAGQGTRGTFTMKWGTTALSAPFTVN